MQVLSIIPARGGSKSVPRKNVRPLAGKPLIAYTIEAALAASSVDRVVVSTDDTEIREIALLHGAEVIDRPAELASDTATSESALLHALDHLEAAEGYRPDLLVFLQCTSPFTLPEDIDNVVAKVRDGGADSALTASVFHGFLWREGEDGFGGINHDKSIRERRQDREPEYLETGAVYAMRTQGFREHRHRFFGRTLIHETPVSRSLEIDDPAELAQAAAIMSAGATGRAKRSLPAELKALIMDFDGVFTDDGVIVNEDGREAVACSRRDGLGIELLRKAGLPMVVISKERVPIVAKRCEKLGIEAYHGIEAKIDLMREWLSAKGIEAADAAYIGNDVNDLACMREVGFAVTPADAHPAALEAADLVLRAGGGRGAVREFADLILSQRLGGFSMAEKTKPD